MVPDHQQSSTTWNHFSPDTKNLSDPSLTR